MILTTDIPIAMIKMAAGSDDDAINRPVQYFTTDKTSNSLTLMYDNSGVGAFAGVISSTASATSWQTMSDITFTNSAATTDIYVQDQMNDAATGPSLNFRNYRASAANNDVGGTINFAVFDNAGGDAPIGKIVSKALNVAASNEYGDMRFSIANQNGSLVETLSLVGSAASGDVRIGANIATPESTLETGGTFGAAFLSVTGTSKTLDVANSFVVFSNASAIAVTMPAVANCTNRLYYLKNDGGGTVTCTRAGSDTFTMATGMTGTTFALAQGEWVTFIGGSGTWHVIQKGTVL